MMCLSYKSSYKFRCTPVNAIYTISFLENNSDEQLLKRLLTITRKNFKNTANTHVYTQRVYLAANRRPLHQSVYNLI